MNVSLLFNSDFLKKRQFLDWGYTEDPVPLSFHRYQSWIEKKNHLPLNYLGDYRKDKRENLKNVFPEFQSALVFLFPYHEVKKWMLEEEKFDVAAYSLGFEGEDYHYTLKKRLELIAIDMGIKNYFISLDAQPVLERDLAYRAGLGWFGKNSMLIHKKFGSYFLLGSLLLDQKVTFPDGVLIKNKYEPDHCGNCRACIIACPTDAINEKTRTLNSSLCLATFSIEVFKDQPPPVGSEHSRGEVFGCDICQDVCPWNKKSLNLFKAKFKIKESYGFLKQWFYEWPRSELLQVIEEFSNRGLRKKLWGTAFARPTRAGWIKNLKRLNAFTKKNNFSEKHRDEE